jgi:glyoxylase-like metal-dependent hydrolase (beta-lactamase superfamily II)
MNIKISALHLGVFSVGQDQDFKPLAPGDKAHPGESRLALNPFLIEQDNRLLLIDTGLGSFFRDDMTPLLLEQIAAHGHSERDITDVICSHIHLDHAGALAHRENGYWELTFPDADIHLSGQEFDKVKSGNHRDIITEYISFLDARASFRFIEDDPEPFAGLRFEIIGGHTEFSLAIRGGVNGKSYLMAGDVLGVRAHVNRKFSAKYDFTPKKSQELRQQLTREAFDNGAYILSYHDIGGPVYRLTAWDEKKGYTIQTAEEEYVEA